MTPEQYSEEIQRTWQTDGLTWREQVCNATLGLVGEAQEYEDSQLSVDELGDVYFYTYTLRRLLGGKYKAGHRKLSHYSELAGWIAEAVKKHLFHGESPGEARELVEDLIYTLHDCARTERYTPGEVMEMNIQKLRKRYPTE